MPGSLRVATAVAAGCLLAGAAAAAAEPLLPGSAATTRHVAVPPAAAAGLPADGENVVRVEVEAERFRFRPARIKAAAGSRLEIVLTSRDVEHGFEIPGTDISVRIPARGGGSVTVVVDVDTAGRLRYRCAHPCGAGHAEMTGVIVVR